MSHSEDRSRTAAGDTITNTNNLNLQDLGGITVAASENVTVNALDGGVIESGFDFSGRTAQRAFDLVGDSRRDAFNLVGDTQRDAFRFVGSSFSEVLGLVQDTQRDSTDIATEALTIAEGVKSGDTSKLIRFGTVGIIVISIAFIISKRAA